MLALTFVYDEHIDLPKLIEQQKIQFKYIGT